MKKLLFSILIVFITGISIYGQGSMYQTWNGDYMNPIDTLRVLNIFINIVFDQTPEADSLKDITTEFWMPGPPNTVNEIPPVYLADYMDPDFDPDNIHGSYTKRWAEASFNKFIVLGDFINVNIAQSRVTPDNPGSTFGKQKLVDSVSSLINENGGLQTHYGHDSLYDYNGSMISSSLRFLPKGSNYDAKIDFIQFFVRNCTQAHGGLVGGGNAIMGLHEGILINGIKRVNNAGTIQGAIKNFNLGVPYRNPTSVHEMAHNLIGMSNSAHMGGGGPVNTGSLVTLDFNSGGWSLISSANSSLVTCNAFERWRLDWRGPQNDNYPIAAGNFNSAIKKADGNKTFYLRDFITYGDAIRIKLPYLDQGALNQYIWLENHQIHNNDKEDYPYFWQKECKDDGMAGVYCYY